MNKNHKIEKKIIRWGRDGPRGSALC